MSGPRPIKYKIDPNKANVERTVCEVHRQLWKAIVADAPRKEIMALLEEAYDLGKRMDAKLRTYKDNYFKDLHA